MWIGHEWHMQMKQMQQQEQLDVLDLPQPWQKPGYRCLLAMLNDLRLEPTSFSPLPERHRDESAQRVAAYLTGWVSSRLRWLASDAEREEIWGLASRRLAERAGRSAVAGIQRSVRVPQEGRTDPIEIMLLEPGLTEDLLGHKTWVGAFVLANKLQPVLQDLTGDGLRILELGAGTGLAGIVAATLLESTASVHLTDLDNIVPNLQHNVTQNEHLWSASVDVQAFALDWTTINVQEQAHYDLVLAADVLYAPEHANLVANVVAQLLRREPEARAVSALPFRTMQCNYHADFASCMLQRGLVKREEGTSFGMEDWYSGDCRQQVRCWWCVWTWSGDDLSHTKKV